MSIFVRPLRVSTCQRRKNSCAFSLFNHSLHPFHPSSRPSQPGDFDSRGGKEDKVAQDDDDDDDDDSLPELEDFRL